MPDPKSHVRTFREKKIDEILEGLPVQKMFVSIFDIHSHSFFDLGFAGQWYSPVTFPCSLRAKS